MVSGMGVVAELKCQYIQEGTITIIIIIIGLNITKVRQSKQWEKKN
jgi:hypothetical protein